MTTRILAIDPGKYTGVTIVDLMPNDEIVYTHVETLDSMNLIRKHKDITFIYGERYAKIYAVAYEISGLLAEFQPHCIVAENAYYNRRRPTAFGSLLELLCILRETVAKYNQHRPLELVKANNVKQAVGVVGGTNDKELVRTAVGLLKVYYEPHICLDQLDEHAIDSMAIGYWKCLNLINDK